MLSVRGAVEKVEGGAARSGEQRGDSEGAGGAHSGYVDLGTEDGAGQATGRTGWTTADEVGSVAWRCRTRGIGEVEEGEGTGTVRMGRRHSEAGTLSAFGRKGKENRWDGQTTKKQIGWETQVGGGHEKGEAVVHGEEDDTRVWETQRTTEGSQRATPGWRKRERAMKPNARGWGCVERGCTWDVKGEKR
ncbi:hypothetical protein ERJ75_000570000 [Trypanosoma vivax]|nr:hypothetical protein ERJ75_000570000 [Trypanosoma vivax]